MQSTWIATPADPLATELTGQLASVREFPRDDGTCFVTGQLATGHAIKGNTEAAGELIADMTYTFLGVWKEDARWGWQFDFTGAYPEAPAKTNTWALRKYLAKYADGVGEVKALALVDAFGVEADRVLISEPHRVEGAGIMSLQEAQAAAASLELVCDPALREAHRDLSTLFAGRGFWAKTLKSALRRWKSQAPAVIRRDPFQMLTRGLPGVGFTKCDRLYLSLQHSPRRLKRQALAAWHTLSEADGDTWMSIRDAFRAVHKAVGDTDLRERRALALLRRAHLIDWLTDADGETWIAERAKSHAERAVALQLRKLMRAPANWPAGPFAGLSDHQQQQLGAALVGPVVLLTGTPGTGKTYCASRLIQTLTDQRGPGSIAVCAPTGKAAVRISEKLAEIGMEKASTIHSLLGVGPSDDGWKFAHGPDNPLPHRLVVVDETSMVDISLAAALLSACSTGTHLLFVGDHHQLPPVGHGAFLRDLISADVPAAHLSEIQRNSGRIVTACKEIKDGGNPKLSESWSVWPEQNLVQLPLTRSKDPKQQQEALLQKLHEVYAWLPTAARPLGKDSKPQPGPWMLNLIDDVQVLVARNATRQVLNTCLQQQLNAAGEPLPVGKWRVGDKVICLRNGFAINANCPSAQVYVANGDIGRVRGCRNKMAVVELRSPARLVRVPLTKQARQQLDDAAGDDDGDGKSASSWDLAYATTVHKYQGSEVPAAIVVMESCGRLASRELIYTAISRAKDLCLLVGDTDLLRRHVRNVTLPDRKTFLVELMKGEIIL